MSLRSSKAVFLIVAALVVIISGFRLLTPRQPLYRGKSLSRWLQDLDFGGPRGAAARTAISEIGTNGLPILIRDLRHRDTSLDRRAFTFAQKYGLGILQEDFARHRRAAQALTELGSAAEPALPALAEAVTTSQAPEQVVEALGRMLPKSVCVLTNAAVACGSEIARQKAIASLVDACSYPDAAAISIAGLSNALHHFVTGDLAIVALARLRDGSYPSEVRQAARQALKTTEPLPQYPESVNALLSGPNQDIPSQLRRRYGLPQQSDN